MKLNCLTNSTLNSFLSLLNESFDKKGPALVVRIKKFMETKGVEHPDEWYAQLVEWCVQADPVAERTKRKKVPYIDLIAKWFLAGEIRFPEDIPTVSETLQDLSVLRGQRPDFKDVDPAKMSLVELRTTMQPHLGKKAAYEKYDYLKKLGSDGKYNIYLVDEWIDGPMDEKHKQLQHKAFEGTKWCVKFRKTFEKSYKGPYFLVTEGNKKYALINIDSRQLKDPMDIPLSAEQVAPIIKLVKLVVSPEAMVEAFECSFTQPHLGTNDWDPLIKYYDLPITDDLVERVMNANNSQGWLNVARATKKRMPKANEARLALDKPDLAIDYTLEFNPANTPDHRWSWFERALLDKDVRELNYAVEYAKRIIKDRWPELEASILSVKNLSAAIQYNNEIMDGEWSEAATLVLDLCDRAINLTGGQTANSHGPNDPFLVGLECCVRSGRRWPEFEQRLLVSGRLAMAVNYAIEVIKDRWPKLELALLSAKKAPLPMDAIAKYQAAIMHGNWLEADAGILASGDAKIIYSWCISAHPGRWPEAEEILFADKAIGPRYAKRYGVHIPGRQESSVTDPKKAVDYAIWTLNNEWPEAEKVILSDLPSAIRYAAALKGPWPELEEAILRGDDDAAALEYSFKVLHNEWPEAEGLIRRNPTLWQKYVVKMKG